MDRDIARLKPANLQTTLPRPEILHADLHGKTQLLAEVHAMARRGEISQNYDLRQVRSGWAVKVMRVAERPSWWHRNGLRTSLWAAGILAFLVLLVILLRLLTLALAALLPVLVGVVILMMVCSAIVMATGGGSVEVLQKVKIKRW